MAKLRLSNHKNIISDKVDKGTHGKQKNKMRNGKVVICLVIILLTVVISIIYGRERYLKIKEEKQQKIIEDLLKHVDEAYMNLAFDDVEEYYDELDRLNYDTTKQREILKYDKQVYKDAYIYFEKINDVDKRLHNGKYSSLRTLMDELKEPAEKFDALEINEDSEIGKYIWNVRNNIMYEGLNIQFVNNSEIDLDYSLISWGYVTILETYTGEIVKEIFPYLKEK